MFNKMKEFIREIGKYSFNKMAQRHQTSFKQSNDILSIVTEVDMHNSNEFDTFLKKNFSNLNYVVIDEEKFKNLEGKLFEEIEKTEYQFIFDPIDGTLNYDSGLPLYGILLSVFKNGKPLYGFIYAPALDEFVYTDGQKVFREHFGKVEIVDNFPRNISRVVQAHSWETKLKPDHIKGKFIVQDYFSASIYSLYLALGQLRGVVSTAKLWDIAPLMTISKILGFSVCDYGTGEDITISPKYISDQGKIKNMMIMGSKDEIEEIRGLFAYVENEGLDTPADLKNRAVANLSEHKNIDKQKQVYPDINDALCNKCGKCIKICDVSEHNALSMSNGKVVVNKDKCIGCSLCSHICPKLAISMKYYNELLSR